MNKTFPTVSLSVNPASSTIHKSKSGLKNGANYAHTLYHPPPIKMTATKYNLKYHSESKKRIKGPNTK